MIKRAVQQRPDDGYIVNSLGWAYFRIGNYDEAVKQLERAIELKPEDPTINDHLGDAYWRVGRVLEAKFQWAHARDLKPDPEDLPKIEAKLKRRAAGRDLVAGQGRQEERRRGLSVFALHMDLFRNPSSPIPDQGSRVMASRDHVASVTAAAGRTGSRQDQSDLARARPPRRRLSRARKPGGVRRSRRHAHLAAGRRCRARHYRAVRRGMRAGRRQSGAEGASPRCASASRGCRPGAFSLDKNLPVAAGLGGGSADAAAALRLLARANDLAPDDPRLAAAAPRRRRRAGLPRFQAAHHARRRR